MLEFLEVIWMAKSPKPKENTYIDSTGIVHNREMLSNILPFIKDLFSVPTKTVTDLDTLNPGVSRFDGGASHSPITTSGKVITICVGNNNYLYQFVIPDYNWQIQVRYRYYSDGWKWSNWLKLDMTWS